MTILKTYILFSICLLLAMTACNDEDESLQKHIDTTNIQAMISEDILLKEAILENDEWVLHFETQTISLPASAISSLDINREKWNTLITFTDETTLSIPTIGNSIDDYIINIEVNPSKFNPLAALASLYLPAEGRIKLIIHTKEGKHTPNVEYLFSSTKRSQDIPILGLYPNYNNIVELIYTNKNGKERIRKILNIQTQPVETNAFSAFDVVVAKPEKMEPGMNLVCSPGLNEFDTSCPYIVDTDGELRWLLDWKNNPDLLHIGAQCSPQRMQNGHYIVGDFNNGQLVEVDLFGAIIHHWDLDAMGYSFHHEVREEANGNLLVAVSKKNALQPDKENIRTLDHIIEINPVQGTVSKEWDLINMMDYSRIYSVGGDPNSPEHFLQPNKSNWLHNNGVTTWGDDDIMATARWQGVFKFSREGSLKWAISPHAYWNSAYKQYLLQPLDKNGQPITDPDVLEGRKSHPDFDWVWGVHCPVVTKEGHVLVFDNGYCRHFTARGKGDQTAYSRIVEYEVNEQNKTIREIWSYGKERGRECYAMAISGVQALDRTGNRLFCPGVVSPLSSGKSGGRIIEIDPRTNEVVFELEVVSKGEHAFHRANRISLYPENL